MTERTKLNDDDLMPFGKWRNTRLGEVPDHYWLWFLKQEWSDKYPDLVAYAKIVEES